MVKSDSANQGNEITGILNGEKIPSKQEEIEEKPGKVWIVALILIISISRICIGIYASLMGLTLLYLADNVNATVGQISSMFSGLTGGIFVGTVLFGAVKKRYPNHKPLTVIAIATSLVGITILVVPWTTNLAALVVLMTTNGLVNGYIEAGLQSLYLYLWGEKGSRPYIHSFHFTFGVGSFIAPIIASPFLQMADQEAGADDSCPNQIVNTPTTVAYNFTQAMSTTPAYVGLNPVAWTYIMTGAFTAAVGLAMLACALLQIEDKVRTNCEVSSEQRPEEPIRDVAVLFLGVALFYFFCSSMQTVFQTYIYSIAICSELGFSVADASTLVSLFWVGFMVGRGSGMIYSNYFTPNTILTVNLITTMTAMIALSIFGNSIPSVLWIVATFYGLAVATVYPTGISWTSQITNVSGSYIFVFGAGNMIGGMTMFPLAGALFDMSPFNVVYLNCALNFGTVVAYLLLLWIGKNHLLRLKQAEDISRDLHYETFVEEGEEIKKSRL